MVTHVLLLAFYFMSKYALPHMHAGDTIINDASVNAYIGRPDLLDYTSSKGAIVAFTRGLSNQYVHKGIRVSHLHIATRAGLKPADIDIR